MIDQTGDVDLFGNLVPAPQPSAADRPPINDMDLVETVLAAAVAPGYRLVGAREKVYRCSETRKDAIEPVPSYEDTAVHQLIDARWLEVGGNHRCCYRQFEGHGRSVLVPRRTKEAMARWRAYKRPTNWPANTKPKITSSETTMTATSGHSAHAVNEHEPYGRWRVSWLPGHTVSYNQATTALVLALHITAGATGPTHPDWAHVLGWAAELDLTAEEAVTAVQRTSTR